MGMGRRKGAKGSWTRLCWFLIGFEGGEDKEDFLRPRFSNKDWNHSESECNPD